MIGTKYLSELVDNTLFQKDKLNIIKSPTGCGKTYFALHHIPSLTTNPTYKIVYLIDTINGKEQIIQNYNAKAEFRGWAKEVGTDGIWFLPEDQESNKEVVVITYAKFGWLIGRNPDFQNRFDYIICDELHSLPKFENFSPKPNLHSIAKKGIECAVKNSKSTVIALSATPNPIIKEFSVPCFEIPIEQQDLIQYEVCQTTEYVNLDEVLSDIDPDEIGVCYISHITPMIEFEENARRMGFSPISFWSISNIDHQMSDEQLEARKSVLETYTIPPQYNLLIINSSSETSIKIKSPVDYVIVHSTNPDTQTQVRGRVNRDLKTLYLRADGIPEITVPEDFLNQRLFAEDKSKLTELLDIRDPRNNRRYQWRGLRPLLIANDYEVSEGRSDNRRYSIIKPSPK